MWAVLIRVFLYVRKSCSKILSPVVIEPVCVYLSVIMARPCKCAACSFYGGMSEPRVVTRQEMLQSAINQIKGEYPRSLLETSSSAVVRLPNLMHLSVRLLDHALPTVGVNLVVRYWKDYVDVLETHPNDVARTFKSGLAVYVEPTSADTRHVPGMLYSGTKMILSRVTMRKNISLTGFSGFALLVCDVELKHLKFVLDIFANANKLERPSALAHRL